MKKIHLTFLMALILAGLTACESGAPRDPYANMSAEEIYSEGRNYLKSGNYSKAASAFEGLESHYPYGEYGEKAQLGAIYAYFKSDESGSALAASDRFLRYHPRHPDVAYAYYIRGLTQYEALFTFPARYLPLNPARRDIDNANLAFADFAELVKRYPQSAYAFDARQRMVYLKSVLAESELFTADYYMRRGAYVAAADRAEYVLENYQGTAQQNKALEALEAAYRELALNDLAGDVASVRAAQ